MLTAGYSLPKILVVDDDEIECTMFEHLLAPYAEISVAKNGQEAIHLCQTNIPDVIVLDIEMPVMGGIEACQTLKSYAAFANVPVVFLSGNTDIELEQRCWAAGGTDYLTKPFNLNVIRYRIGRQLALKRHIEDLKKITLFGTAAKVMDNSWIESMLDNQLRVSSRRSLPLSLICVDLGDVDVFITKNGYSHYDILISRLSQLLEICSLHQSHFVIRASRTRFFCLFPESGEESARHFGFMIYQHVFIKDKLRLEDQLYGFQIKVLGVTNYCMNTRSHELMNTLEDIKSDLTARDISRGMQLRINAGPGADTPPLTANWCNAL